MMWIMLLMVLYTNSLSVDSCGLWDMYSKVCMLFWMKSTNTWSCHLDSGTSFMCCFCGKYSFHKNKVTNTYNKLDINFDESFKMILLKILTIIFEILLINLIVKDSLLLHFLMSQAFSKETCLKKITIFKNQLTNPKIYLANLKTYLVLRYAYIKIANMIRCKLPKTNLGFNNITKISIKILTKILIKTLLNLKYILIKFLPDTTFFLIIFLDTQNLTKLSVFCCSIYFSILNYIKNNHGKKCKVAIILIENRYISYIDIGNRYISYISMKFLFSFFKKHLCIPYFLNALNIKLCHMLILDTKTYMTKFIKLNLTIFLNKNLDMHDQNIYI